MSGVWSDEDFGGKSEVQGHPSSYVEQDKDADSTFENLYKRPDHVRP